MLSLQHTQSDHGAMPLVFIHGWGSSSAIWQAVCERLPGDHWRLDLPGFGRAPAEPVDWDAILDELAERLPVKAVLVGWSLGGILATRFAQRHPEKLAGLVTLATNACFVANDEWPNAMAPTTFNQFASDFAEDPAATWLRFCALQGQGDRQRKAVTLALRAQDQPDPSAMPAWRQGLNWLAQLNNRAALQSLALPSLHIFGEGDALVPAAAAGETARLGRAQVVVLEGTGHALPVSQPEAVARLIHGYCLQRQMPAKTAVASAFGRAAPGYDRAARVQLQCAQTLAHMAPPVEGGLVLDLGCGTGFVAEALAERQGAALPVVQLDLALGMVQAARGKLSERLTQTQWLVADAEFLPLASERFAVAISNFVFQWCAEPSKVLQEAWRVLQPGGALLFTTLGPKTLGELKSAWAALDGFVHVNHFEEASRWQQALEEVGFEIGEFQNRQLTTYYDQLMSLLKDLKAIGAHNMNSGRNPGLTSPARLKALAAEYDAFRDAERRLPATYDVYFVLARKPL